MPCNAIGLLAENLSPQPGDKFFLGAAQTRFSSIKLVAV